MQVKDTSREALAERETRLRKVRAWLGSALWDGVARIFDFGNVLGPYRAAQAPEEADYWALRSDCEAVGRDLQAALAQFAATHAEELAETPKVLYGPTA